MAGIPCLLDAPLNARRNVWWFEIPRFNGGFSLKLKKYIYNIQSIETAEWLIRPWYQGLKSHRFTPFEKQRRWFDLYHKGSRQDLPLQRSKAIFRFFFRMSYKSQTKYDIWKYMGYVIHEHMEYHMSSHFGYVNWIWMLRDKPTILIYLYMVWHIYML